MEKKANDTRNYFEILNDINVNDHKEPKGKLTYLSWVWAWGEVKKLHPDLTMKVYENADGWMYHTDGRTAWVKVGVTINGIEYIEYLPIMDNRNAAIPFEKVTSFDANTAIQRAATKAIARHGLGLYIYAGEDLPECEQEEPPEKPAPAAPQAPAADGPKPATPYQKTTLRRKMNAEQREWAEKTYGKDYERLSWDGADKLIKKLDAATQEGEQE